MKERLESLGLLEKHYSSYGPTGAGVTVLIVALILGVVVLALSLGAWSCSSYSQRTGRVTDFLETHGCYVQANDGQWWPQEQYEQIRVEGYRP